jgi:hypothetical protein
MIINPHLLADTEEGERALLACEEHQKRTGHYSFETAEFPVHKFLQYIEEKKFVYDFMGEEGEFYGVWCKICERSL